ncbi:unnamed protein product [Moneuplotes crassus]|uniref:PPPDE domain-containing protein n=1 Tax=Euplotes crassus TaxID=5936 RepID=A0AAD1XLW5_EUPCR|nr:unnamed protein product [Moneuplotes crassus]
MAKKYSTKLFGKHYEAIYHLAIEVYGVEYCSGSGTEGRSQGSLCYTTIDKSVDYGQTDIDQKTFHEFINGMCRKYSKGGYDIVTNNCNHYCNELLQFLTGKSVSEEILIQVEEILKNPACVSIAPLIKDKLDGFVKGEFDIFQYISTTNGEIDVNPNILALFNNIAITQETAVAKLEGPANMLTISDYKTLEQFIQEMPRCVIYFWSPDADECKEADEEISCFAKKHTSKEVNNVIFASINAKEFEFPEKFVKLKETSACSYPKIFLFNKGKLIKKLDTFNVAHLEKNLDTLK